MGIPAMAMKTRLACLLVAIFAVTVAAQQINGASASGATPGQTVNTLQNQAGIAGNTVPLNTANNDELEEAASNSTSMNGKNLANPDDLNDQGSIAIAVSSAAGGNCSKNCSGHGTCSRGRCVCESPYSGAACDVKVTCPNNCGGHGRCSATGKCVCVTG